MKTQTNIRLGAVAKTHIGKVRKQNQDSHLKLGNFFAVADGMGGPPGGDVASQTTIATLRDLMEQASRPMDADYIKRAFYEANSDVREAGSKNMLLRGLGTTLVSLALVYDDNGDPIITIHNVGDSRAYLFVGEDLSQITEDHSDNYGYITSALGMVAPKVDIFEMSAEIGERYLLCSDGLTNMVPDYEIEMILNTHPDRNEAADALINAALKHGGRDNITVLIVDVEAA